MAYRSHHVFFERTFPILISAFLVFLSPLLEAIPSSTKEPKPFPNKISRTYNKVKDITRIEAGYNFPKKKKKVLVISPIYGDSNESSGSTSASFGFIAKFQGKDVDRAGAININFSFYVRKHKISKFLLVKHFFLVNPPCRGFRAKKYLKKSPRIPLLAFSGSNPTADKKCIRKEINVQLQKSAWKTDKKGSAERVHLESISYPEARRLLEKDHLIFQFPNSVNISIPSRTRNALLKVFNTIEKKYNLED